MPFFRQALAVKVVSFLLLLLTGCCKSKMPINPPETEIIEDVDGRDAMSLARNSVLGHDERMFIVGRFDGKASDTLTIQFVAWEEYADTVKFITLDGRRFEDDDDPMAEWRHLWDVLPARGTVLPLRVFGVSPLLVYEGDLDGNGTDEFGILSTWYTSGCRVYNVYTFHAGNWCLLIPPVQTATSLRASGKDLVSPGDLSGQIRVTMSDLETPPCNCTYANDIDTIITATFDPITTI